MLIGTLKAMLKNGVIEFFNNWQGFLDKTHPLPKPSISSLFGYEKSFNYNSLIYGGGASSFCGRSEHSKH